MILAEIAIASFLIARLCIAGALILGLVDRPDARKQHQGAIPLSGGIAIFFTIVLGNLVLDIPPYTPQLLLVALAVFLVGVFDDIRHIHAGARLMILFSAGALMATFGGIAIHQVGNLLGSGDIQLLFMTVPLTALAVAGLSNAYNMIDGIDGLAASTIALPLLVLYTLATLAGHPQASFLLLMLVPLGVFLVFNLGPNNALLPKMFLGDGGSVTLGLLVTASLVYFSQGEQALIQPVTALWLVTVPLMDMLATMLRRARAGRALMSADRSHLHHALLDRGISSRRVLLVMLIHAVAAAITGLALEAAPAWVSLLCYFMLFLGHCAFVMRSDRLAKTSPTVGIAAANDPRHAKSCAEKAAS